MAHAPVNHGQIFNPQLAAIMRAESLHTVDFDVPTADDDYFLAASQVTTGTDQTTEVSSFTKDSPANYPVCPTVTVVENSGSDITAVEVSLSGIDQFGDFITETGSATYTSGTGWVYACNNAFLKLELLSVVTTGDTATNDIVQIGFAKKYGLGRRIAKTAEVYAHEFDGSNDAGTINVAYSTYDIAGTPDCNKMFNFLMIPTFYTGRA